MNVKLRVLTIGVLFFAGQTVMAQKAKAKRDTTTKVKDIEEVVILGYGRKESSTEKVGNYAVVGKEKLENALIKLIGKMKMENIQPMPRFVAQLKLKLIISKSMK